VQLGHRREQLAAEQSLEQADALGVAIIEGRDHEIDHRLAAAVEQRLVRPAEQERALARRGDALAQRTAHEARVGEDQDVAGGGFRHRTPVSRGRRCE
jgi:hypothetical protein